MYALRKKNKILLFSMPKGRTLKTFVSGRKMVKEQVALSVRIERAKGVAPPPSDRPVALRAL